MLKDDADLVGVDFGLALAKNKGAPLQALLMGSATLLAAPKTKTVFLEDLPPEQIAQIQEPSGLINLGNTCYLNSVVQCLRVIPSFRKGLAHFQEAASSTSTTNPTPPAGRNNTLFLTALADLYNQLDRTANPVMPSAFVTMTKVTFPQFQQMSPHGQPMQQDAEEFFSGLLAQSAVSLPVSTLTNSTQNLMGATNLIDATFGMVLEETMVCDESSDEPPVISTDLHRKLVCNIQGGTAGQNVDNIDEGIKLALEGKIEKNSPLLGRNAMWTRRQRISRLPSVLVVQFGRFYWKETPDSQDHAGVKCKIMKKVAFSSTLDVYEFCSPSVQQILKANRDQAAAEEEERIQRTLQGAKAMDVDTTSTTMSPSAEVAADHEEDELQAAIAMSLEPSEEVAAVVVGPGLSPNFMGHYELFAVVTHKGRSADGGHYMGWIKAESAKEIHKKVTTEGVSYKNDDDDNWFVFNDDEVSPCKAEDILKLQGGGDYDMSYLNFYRAKD